MGFRRGPAARRRPSWPGQAPRVRHLVAAWHLHGAGFVAHVLAPGSAWAKAGDLDQALAAIEAKLGALGERIAVLRREGG